MSPFLSIKVKIIVWYGDFFAFIEAALMVIYVDFSAVSTWYIIFHSMLLLSELRGNYCFKNVKLLLIVSPLLSNLPPQVNIVHCRRGWGFPQTVGFYRKGNRCSLVNEIHKLSPSILLKPFSSYLISKLQLTSVPIPVFFFKCSWYTMWF